MNDSRSSSEQLSVAARLDKHAHVQGDVRALSRTRLYSVAVGTVIGVALISTLFTHVTGQSVLARLRAVHVHYLWLAIGCSLVGFSLRAWRWQLLMRPIQSVSFRLLLAAELIGFAGNSLLPFRVGEALKSVTVCRLAGMSLATVLGTLATAGVFNSLALGVLLLCGVGMFPALPFDHRVREYGSVAIGVLFACVIAFWFIMRYQLWGGPDWSRHGPTRITTIVSSAVTSFLTGFRCIQTARQALVVSTLSCLLWLSLAGRFYFVAWALDLDLPLSAIVLVQAIVGVGTIVPVSPAQLGTFELSTILGLRLFTVDENTALACALLVRLVYSGPALLLGVMCAMHLGVQQWSSITKKC